MKNASSPNFWPTLPRPFFVLAPMANVTDSVFRRLFAEYGKPDVTWTEFVSADGLCSPKGRDALLRDLEFSKAERPIVAQLFTGHPDAMGKAAQLVAELGFDGLDINMGCPDRAVEKQGGGAANMKDQKNALKVLEAAREGVAEATSKKQKGKKSPIPVTVKTRIGYNKVDLGWIKLLLEQGLPALTVHLRTRKEMSAVPAHWELMPEIVKMRDHIQAHIPTDHRTLIIGNGDVSSLNEAAAKVKQYGCDGIMIGRGIFGTPWFFEKLHEIQDSRLEILESKILNLDSRGRTPEERLKIMLEHARLFDKAFCGTKHVKNFAVMKKHFKAYVSGWDGAKELRAELMETTDFKEVKRVIDAYLKKI